MKYLTGFDRRQATLFPTCIDDLIPEDAEVRVIDLFVDALPLKDLGFGKSAGGRRPADVSPGGSVQIVCLRIPEQDPNLPAPGA